MKENSKTSSIMVVLFLGVLMGALDIAIVGPALTPIRQSFGVNLKNITWIFNIYVLMNLIATPVLAKISDLAGRKPIYIISVSLFAIGSAIVALSQSYAAVLIGRAVQGFGAGGIFPVASAVIGDIYPPEKRGRALGLIGSVFGIAFVIGPLIGGVLLMAGWHWIFIVNLPISVLLIVLAAMKLPKARKSDTKRFDWAGTVLVAAALGSFVYGLNRIDTSDFAKSVSSLYVWPFILGAVILFTALVLVEKRSRNPVIPPVLFNKRQLNVTHVLAFGAGLAQIVFVFIPSLALIAFHVSNSVASFMLLPSVFGMVIGSPTSGRMIDTYGVKPVILIGLPTMVTGLVLIFFFMKLLPVFLIASFLVGLGLSGVLGAPLRYILLDETEKEYRSTAQGLMSIFSSSGQIIGAVVAGMLVVSAREALTGYSYIFLMVAGLSLLLLLAAFFLKNTRVAKDSGGVDDSAVPKAEPAKD